MAAQKKSVKAKKEYPLAHLLEKDPTPVMENFADWIEDQTGYEVDRRSVALAGTLRMVFQKSPENQADLEERRQAAEDKKAARLERQEARAAKVAQEAKAAKTAKPAAKAPAKAPATKAAPAKRTPAAKAAATTKAAPRRRRPAADDDI